MMTMMQAPDRASAPGRVVIIGGGPAGLTAAAELVTRSAARPIVLEAHDQLGGLSRTINYNGNRLDIGGHRFFSKSDRVMRRLASKSSEFFSFWARLVLSNTSVGRRSK